MGVDEKDEKEIDELYCDVTSAIKFAECLEAVGSEYKEGEYL